MSMRIGFLGALLLSALLSAPALAQDDLRTLTTEQMEEDLFTLFDHLQAQHGGLYRYATPEEIEGALGEALSSVAEERTAVEFHRTVSALLAQSSVPTVRILLTAAPKLACPTKNTPGKRVSS